MRISGVVVSKLFRAYRLYNIARADSFETIVGFQSSFELTGYITIDDDLIMSYFLTVSKLFRAYRLYNLCSLEGA